MTFEKYYQNLTSEIKEYFKTLTFVFPRFLIPYIETNTMMRLKDIGYFCGMDNANKEVYNFKYYLSRLDHSISTALIVWNHTYDKKQTLAALFHDAATPAFSHVIDYMNNDSLTEESTEIDLKSFLIKDTNLLELLKKDSISLEEISNYKQYPMVDNKRPKLCADRLDGIFLTSLVWTQKTDLNEIKKIYANIIIKKNEEDAEEYSFIDLDIADRVVELNEYIDKYTHSNEDYYSMMTMSAIVKSLIVKKIIKYEDLWVYTDKDLMQIINNQIPIDSEIKELYDNLITLRNMQDLIASDVKNRRIDPLVLSKRYSTY